MGPVGDVAGLHPRVRAQGGQLGDQFRRPVGVRTPAADEQQVPGAVPRRQSLGDQGSQAAGAAGDQDRPLRVQRQRGPVARTGAAGADESRCQDSAAADGELGLGRCGQGVPVRGLAVVVEVGQEQPAGVLGLGAADQTPYRRL